VSSRRSSVSSVGLDMECTPSRFAMINFSNGDTMSPCPFQTTVNSTVTATPTKFEAETLVDTFFVQVNRRGYSVDRQVFQAFLDMIYTHGTNAYPRSVALYHVFMAMATALRAKIGRGGPESSLLNNCYRLAMEQAQTPEFWSQQLGNEAAILLVLFAQAAHGVSMADQVQFY
jgi:hypothetical protein